MVAVVSLLAVAWYALRAAARWSQRAARVVARVSPWTARLHQWVLASPATFAYIAVFTASTVIQRSVPPRLVEIVTTLDSTNLHHLSDQPVRVLVLSMLWVADRGVGYELYVAVFATVVAWAEQRFGTPRIIVIGVGGHVLASLLTALVEVHAIRTGLAPARLANTPDVGISYVMVAGCTAAVLALRGRARYVAAGVLSVLVLVPLVATHTIWDVGHLIAMLCGFLVTATALRVAPLRPALT